LVSALGAVGVLGLGALAVRGVSVAQSCFEVAEGAIVESQEFTPYEAMLTSSPERPMSVAKAPLNLNAGSAAVPGNTLDGLPLQQVAFDKAGGIYQFFLDGPIEPDLTVSAFTAAGGIRYSRLPTDGNDDYVNSMLKEFPGRAVPIEIAGHAGVLTWADPDAHGVRPHHLYWSDGTYGYVLIADRSAVSIVNLARNLACGG
jgi:hypothetical protein